MADTIQIKNKNTGEIITLRRKASDQQGALPQAGKTEALISRRGTAMSNAKEALGEIMANPILGATMNPTSAKLIGSIISAPREIAESAIAAPIYEALRGNIKGIPQAMQQAITQEKPTQFGDIVRGTGIGGKYNNWIAATTGLAASMGALDVVAKKAVSKGLTDIGKVLFSKRPRIMNDTYLKSMSKKAFDGIEGAKDAVGGMIGKVKAGVAEVEVDRNILNKIMKDVPAVAKKEIRKKLKIKEVPQPTLYDATGKLIVKEPEFISQKITIDDIDKMKVMLGDLRSDSSWAKGARGLSESIREKRIGEAYDDIRKLITSTLVGKGKKREAKILSGLNEQYTEIKRVGGAIKDKIVDKTGAPVKTKALINMMKDKEEAGGRDLIERMGKYTDAVGKAARMANSYIMRERIKGVAQYVGKIGGLGGAVYAGRRAIGERILGEES